MNSTIGYFVVFTPCYHIFPSVSSVLYPSSDCNWSKRTRSSCPSQGDVFCALCLWVLPSALQRAPRDLLRQYKKVVILFFFPNLSVVQKLEKGKIARGQCNSPVSRAPLLSQVAVQLLLCLQGNHSHWQPLTQLAADAMQGHENQVRHC